MESRSLSDDLPAFGGEDNSLYPVSVRPKPRFIHVMVSAFVQENRTRKLQNFMDGKLNRIKNDWFTLKQRFQIIESDRELQE